ncbi:hypothetical protein [Methylobacterium aquaticum]|jgi:hypothetical protein|uniref:Uncharacterized protein n=1 Tax=Methylobacterium aquaticum TaxID=270351 RepID=A0A0J6SKU4_9HYPH|nr:hypothetical protein [Methylobacterium aquaticum]KMO34279.1 hypothetical protein VP06_14480 [Methylobacterium aquaticum]
MRRRAVPMKVQRDAALDLCAELMRKLGMIPVEVETVEWQLDHNPALALRPIDPVTGEHQPHQHSRKHLVWMTKAAHREKTTGRRGTSDLSLRDGDQGKIAKVDRLQEQQAEFRERLLAKGEPRDQPERSEKRSTKWPKRPFSKKENRRV